MLIEFSHTKVKALQKAMADLDAANAAFDARAREALEAQARATKAGVERGCAAEAYDKALTALLLEGQRRSPFGIVRE